MQSKLMMVVVMLVACTPPKTYMIIESKTVNSFGYRISGGRTIMDVDDVTFEQVQLGDHVLITGRKVTVLP